jgi:hypothetical protein
MRARTADARTCCVCKRARSCGCASGRSRNRAEPCEPFPSAWTACGSGAQAFSSASAFNANIGSWNTARVTSLAYVCAASGSGGAPPRASRTRSAGPRCGAAGCARRHRRRARACARGRTRLRGAMGIAMAARGRDSIYMRFDTYTYIYIHVYIRTGRVDVCVYQCAMVIHRLYVRMRWWARVAATAAHCIRSAPGAPSMSLPDLCIATCVYL